MPLAPHLANARGVQAAASLPNRNPEVGGQQSGLGWLEEPAYGQQGSQERVGGGVGMGGRRAERETFTLGWGRGEDLLRRVELDGRQAAGCEGGTGEHRKPGLQTTGRGGNQICTRTNVQGGVNRVQ